MPELIHQELTGDIIGAYYEVYNHTPRTYPKVLYERAMVEELRLRGRATTWQDKSLSLRAGHAYHAPGEDTIMVKVINILGNDTTRILKVKGA